ncbi:HAD-IA family hydrolase [Streptomyces sp. WAC00469]|uniref:HAD family hydrolase n=2 Tax=Streptomyces TaxID=1883 RepID=UPI0028AB6319|nr:HAD-IA family hydrolase [Streptomyces sp. WAC00469]
MLDEAGPPLDPAAPAGTARALEEAGALPAGHTAPAPPGRPGRAVADPGPQRRTAPGRLHRSVPPGAPARSCAARRAVRTAHAPGRLVPLPGRPEVLRTLRERGVKVGVVSDIGWDLRPVFREHGLGPYVDTYVLSYEHGVQKPDPRLFEKACTRLGVDPRQVLMVGDSRDADGGASALGCPVHFVDHRPVAERPDGLGVLSTEVGDSDH